MEQVYYKGGLKYNLANQRDPGFEHETNDCVVRAVCNTTGIPYREAHEYVAKRFGRRDKQGTKGVPAGLKAMAANKELLYGYRIFDRSPLASGTVSRVATDSYGHRMRYVRPKYPTLAEIQRQHPKGRFMLVSNNHASTMIDGVIKDAWAFGARSRIKWLFELIPSSQVKEN